MRESARLLWPARTLALRSARPILCPFRLTGEKPKCSALKKFVRAAFDRSRERAMASTRRSTDRLEAAFSSSSSTDGHLWSSCYVTNFCQSRLPTFTACSLCLLNCYFVSLQCCIHLPSRLCAVYVNPPLLRRETTMLPMQNTCIHNALKLEKAISKAPPLLFARKRHAKTILRRRPLCVVPEAATTLRPMLEGWRYQKSSVSSKSKLPAFRKPLI
jgi:hypothetical protein